MWVQFGHLSGSGDVYRGVTGQPRQPLTHRELRRMAQRSSGSAALAGRARQGRGRTQIIPFGCAAERQPPTATLAATAESEELFPPWSVTQRRGICALGSGWPDVIGPAE